LICVAQGGFCQRNTATLIRSEIHGGLFKCDLRLSPTSARGLDSNRIHNEQNSAGAKGTTHAFATQINGIKNPIIPAAFAL
jgi:hypothetical protein